MATTPKMTRAEFMTKYGLGAPRQNYESQGATFLADDKGGNVASEIAGDSVGDFYDKYIGPNARTTRWQPSPEGEYDTGEAINWDPSNKYNGAVNDVWSYLNPHPESSRGNGWDESWKAIGRPIATAAAMYYGGGALNGLLGEGAGAAGTAAMDTDAALAAFDTSQAGAGGAGMFGGAAAPVEGASFGGGFGAADLGAMPGFEGGLSGAVGTDIGGAGFGAGMGEFAGLPTLGAGGMGAGGFEFPPTSLPEMPPMTPADMTSIGGSGASEMAAADAAAKAANISSGLGGAGIAEGLGGAASGLGGAASGLGGLGNLGLKDIAGIAAGLGGFANSLGGSGGSGGSSDPMALAREQADAQSRLLQQQTVANRPNQVGPNGSSTWTQDPATGQWTQKTELNAQDQARLDSQRQASGTMASAGAALAPGVAAGYSHPLNYDNATKMSGYDLGAINQATGKMDAGFDSVQGIRDAMMSRLQPQRDAARASEQQRLRNQGLTDTSEAYNTAMSRLDRGDTDAQMQALLAGASEHNNIFNRQLARGNQMFGQQGSMANLSGQQRQQNISEANALRDRPLTELNAMMGNQVASKVDMPQFATAGLGQSADLLGASNAQNANNATAAAQKASNTQGMFGLASSLLGGKNGLFGG